MSDLNRLLALAARGKHSGASGGERKAAALVECVLEHAPGLDGDAVSGLLEWIVAVIDAPMSSQDLWDHVRNTGG